MSTNRSASCGPWRRPRRRPRKKKTEDIHKEVTREVDQLLRVAFSAHRKTGHWEMEALEMAVRSAMHRAGAAALTQLLQFPVPAAGQRASLALAAATHIIESCAQAGPHGGRPGGGIAALLPMPGLPSRPIPRRCRTGHSEHGVPFEDRQERSGSPHADLNAILPRKMQSSCRKPD